MMLLRSRTGIALFALLLTLPAACAHPCPKGTSAVSVPCHTVVTHRLVAVRLSLDRPVSGWSVRAGGSVVPLGAEAVAIQLHDGGPEEAVVLEGPLGKTLPLRPPPLGGPEFGREGGYFRNQLTLPGDAPVTLAVAWTVATAISECHGAPPRTTCESRS